MRVRQRWVANGSLWLIASAVTAIIVPAGVYALAAAQPTGRLAALPAWAGAAAAFLLLDAWKYAEHRVFHAMPLMWRAHLVHHSDTDVDVTTSERHHPIEVVASTVLLVAVVLALGLPAAGVGVYLVAGTAIALASHANLRLPRPLERALRTVLVTPAVHAVHHSALRAQTDSNFGQVLTLWDRLFGTYVNPDTTRIARFGLESFRAPADATIDRVLAQPFRRPRAASEPPHADAEVATATRVAWTPAQRNALFAGALGIALVLAAMAPAVAGLVALWRDHEAYQYAWLVVPTVAYTLVARDRPPLDPCPDWSGLPWALAAAVAWVAATLMNVELGRQIALVVAVQAVLMSTLGRSSYRQHLPALLLLFAIVPCGDLVLGPLRRLTLASIDVVASFAGLSRDVDGYVIAVAGRRYIVIDDCAGLVNVTLGAFVGYALGLFAGRSFSRVVALAAAGALLGIAANVVRVNAIVLVDAARGSQMDLSAHGIYQSLALLGGIGALLALFAWLDVPASHDGAADNAAPRSVPLRRAAPLAAGVAGVVIACAAAGLHAARDSGAAPEIVAALPPTLGGWERVGVEATVEDGNGIAVRRARYADGNRSLDVAVFETRAPAAKLTDATFRPDDGTRWHDKRRERVEQCDAQGCVRMTHLTLSRDGARETREAYFVYAVDHEVVGSPLTQRALQAWRRLRGHEAAALLLGVMSREPLDARDVTTKLRALDAAPP